MSYSQSFFFSSSTSFSSSINGHTTGHRAVTTAYSDPTTGTHVKAARQTLGEPVVAEERHYDRYGRELPASHAYGYGGSNRRLEGAAAAAVPNRRIEDVTDREEEEEAGRRYRRAMEEEYAKREGGA